MVLQIAVDIRIVMLLLFFILAGFAQAFWLLAHFSDDPQFGNPRSAFITTFLFMLGQGTSADFTNNTVAPDFSILLLVIFTTFMSILLLNMLIAQMGDSYNKVREKGPGQWRYEQASILLEQWFMIDKKVNNVPPFLHVLQYVNVDQVASKNYSNLKKNIVEHIEFLKDDMNVYNINNIIYNTKEINKQLKSSQLDIKKELNKLFLNNKTNTELLETKIQSLEEKINKLLLLLK
jgi:hypothetical protein